MSLPAVKHDEVILNETISLKQFPPILRKVAKKVLESDSPMSIADAARDLKLNIGSIHSTIYREKQKGNDFVCFIRDQAKLILNLNRVGVYNAVIQDAVSGASTSHNNQKLFAQLTGDLKDDVRVNIGTLAIGINASPIIQNPDNEKGVIDVEPVIPDPDDVEK